jgi:hypothetical protein
MSKPRRQKVEERAMIMTRYTDEELALTLSIVLNNRSGSIDFLIAFLKKALEPKNGNN